jgi:hypothetical protein
LEKQHQTTTATISHERGSTDALLNDNGNLRQTITIPLMEEQEVAATISTPVSYDEETGMVQTAVRAIVQHPLSTLVDNSVVGLSSTFVITTGALHEVMHALELEWTHHATSSTESLAIISLGHFLHYGRETIRQLVEYHDEKKVRHRADQSPNSFPE